MCRVSINRSNCETIGHCCKLLRLVSSDWLLPGLILSDYLRTIGPYCNCGCTDMSVTGSCRDDRGCDVFNGCKCMLGLFVCSEMTRLCRLSRSDSSTPEVYDHTSVMSDRSTRFKRVKLQLLFLQLLSCCSKRAETVQALSPFPWL